MESNEPYSVLASLSLPSSSSSESPDRLNLRDEEFPVILVPVDEELLELEVLKDWLVAPETPDRKEVALEGAKDLE